MGLTVEWGYVGLHGVEVGWGLRWSGVTWGYVGRRWSGVTWG